MGLILNIETSSYVCSVVLAENDRIIAEKESREDKTHAALLTLYIEEILKEQNISAKDIDAVAVSKGPGSYTGLRIGVSSAKGICYGNNIPLIAICSLHSMAQGILNSNEFIESNVPAPILLCPMIDARRMEVYSALYDENANPVSAINAKIIDEGSFQKELHDHNIVFFGNGASKCESVLKNDNAFFIHNFHPSARFMINLSKKAYETKDFEDTAYFEPFYLKDFVPTVPKKNIIKNM